MEVIPFVPQGFSHDIFSQRYGFTEDETWEQSALRVATQSATAELPSKVEKYKKRFYDVIVSNYFMPAGRIMYGSGRPNPALLNCYVLGSVLDSKEGWGSLLREIVVTSMAGGGCGIDYSDIRPDGAEIKGQRGTCSGPLGLMRGVNAAADMVRAGGGRRSALMMTLDLDHPDILKFLDAKLVKGELTLANISVRSLKTKDFVSAVLENGNWELSWKNKYKTIIPAKILWDKIVQNAWKSAEPGFLNVELARSDAPSSYHSEIQTSNPSLRRGTLVLTKEGVMPIEQLEGQTFLVKNLHDQWSKANCFLSGRRKQLWKITFDNRAEIFCTKEHKWPVLTFGLGWAKTTTDKLQPKDFIPLPRTSHIGFDSEHEDARERGFHMGWLYGDGWFGIRKIGPNKGNYFVGYIFNSEEKYIGERILKFVNSKKNNLSELKDNRDGTYGIQISDQHFIKRLIEDEGLDIKDKGLPEGIWIAGDQYIKGFVDGLFSADGCVSRVGSKSNRGVVLTSSRINMVIDLQKLWSFYGIRSYIMTSKQRTRFPNGTEDEFVVNRLTVCRTDIQHFSEVFSLSSKHKQLRLKALGNLKKMKTHKGEVQRIKLIEKTEIYEDVWDISVFDNTHCFRIENGVTGNCGEQLLPDYGNCCLGHLVLPRFIDGEGSINWPLMGEVIRTGVRFLDNILDVNIYPLQEQKDQALKERRIGLGVTGFSDFLTKLSIKYGSEEGNKMTDKLFRFIAKQAYEGSVFLAAEKGAFPACKPELHVKTGFVKRMTSKIKSMILEHGIRNTALLSVAPTGTTSIVSGNCSSGLEPMFAPAYWRNFWDGTERKRELCFHPLFVAAMEAGKSIDHFIPSSEINVEQHLEIQKIAQKHIDGAISKTIILPKNYSIKKLSKIWLEYLPYLKGTTFYREGSRNFVDENGVEHEPPLVAIPIKEAIELFKENKELKKEAASVSDCPKGVCDI